MAYRTMTLTNGDTVRITESVLKGQGPQGNLGPAGPPGVATTIRGHVANAAALPLTGRQGDSYVADDTGHLWSWDMILSVPQWVDCGRIVGPSGNQSIGASRTRPEEKTIATNVSYAVEYTAMPYNDPDPLESGGSQEGAVLDESKCTATNTVVLPTYDAYYLTTTRFTVESDVENPIIVVLWRNASTATITGVQTYEGYEWEMSPGVEGDIVLNHVAVLKTKNIDQWQLIVKPSTNVKVTALETIWTRIGGGQGPEGEIGPPPVLYVGTVDSVDYGSQPIFTLTETTEGQYRVDVGLPEGPQGVAGSGYDTFNKIVEGGASESDPGGALDYWTDQSIPVPDGERKPAIPWYLRVMAESIFRKLVSRVTTAQKNARGTPQAGEMVYDSDLKQFQGVMPNGAATAWFVIPTIEYGQSSGVYHGASTVRPNGSLYFKYET